MGCPSCRGMPGVDRREDPRPSKWIKRKPQLCQPRSIAISGSAHRTILASPKVLLRLGRFIALLIASWTVMVVVHELGHIVCGWYCGGRLQSVDLVPWHLPYSLFDPDPAPLLTLWGGPILGVFVPVGIAWFAKQNAFWFIANFCLLANGSYIAIAWITGDRYLDTPKLLEHGAHPLSLLVYCLLTIGFGYPGFKGSCIQFLAPAEVKTLGKG